MVLRASPHKGSANFGMARALAEAAVGSDEHGYRREFLGLVGAARNLAGESAAAPAIAGAR
jgi:hypothetical protein